MKFQLQQKGLFTFYKQQEIFEQEIQKKKRLLRDKTETQRKVDATPKFNHESEGKSPGKNKIQSQPTPKSEKFNESQKIQNSIRYKKYGQAVVIVNRKETEHLKPTEIKYDSPNLHTKDQGYFIENKNLAFDSPYKESRKERQTLTRRKILFAKRREDSVMSSKRYEQGQERTERLPTLTKGQTTRNSQPPSHYRNKINGSLIKSNGSDLLKQIRSNVLNESRQQKEEVKRSVSYIEYNRDYYNDAQFKKKEKLSHEQKKLLEILSRYRRNDF